MNAVSSAAAEYVGHGFAALPLRPGSKLPATAHGKKDVSTDAVQVAAWFPDDTNKKIGILTGEKSGLLVLDIDPRNGGNASFERLERTFGKLPYATMPISMRCTGRPTTAASRHSCISFSASSWTA